MSEYSDRGSIYENSDYPSRRQAPGSARSPEGGRPSSSGGGAPRKRKRKRNPVLWGIGLLFKVLGTLILVGLCTGALLACFAAVYINEVIVPIADLSLDDFPLGENSIMYYLDKESGQYKEMTTLLSVTKSMWVDYEDMPEYLKQATVAIEDKRFWTHPGVDWRGTAKAVLRMFTGGEISGGSTITQQLIKNTTNYNETTVKRKITEIVRALRFTQNNSKDDTLEYYLNIIPLGSGCEGVGAAAREYFGKSVSELTLAECASLVGITNNPSKYGPYSFARSQGFNTDEIWDARQWNKYRQEVILNQMLEQGMISRTEYDRAVAQELVFVRDEGTETDTEIYTWYEETVISDVRRALAEQRNMSDRQIDLALQRGGLRIYTCYDPELQAVVDEIYTNRENLDYTSKDGQQMQSAICVIDNQTGSVAAIAGMFGEKTVNRGSNYANSGHRQPGSSLKPLAVYSPALEFNKVNPFSVLDDYPYRLNGSKAWPLNSGTSRYQGHVTLREALRQSLNTVAVRLMNDYVSPEESFKFVQDRYHIDLEDGQMVNGEWKTDITESLALGGLTWGVSARDMAEAYSVFPNNGVYQGSRTFTRVTQVVDGREELLIDNTLPNDPVIKETTAWYMNDMLQGVFTGTGTAYGLGIPGQHAAGKTGTTSDNNDRWFVGYTPYYTAAVWVGYERPYKMSLQGKNPAAVLWNKVMVPLHDGLPDKDYPDPGGRRTVTYCMDSGLLAHEWCAMDPRGSRVGSGSIFPESYPEGRYCEFHTEQTVVTICTECPALTEDGSPTGLYHLAGEFCPEESRRQICLPSFGREQVGAAVAGDAQWDYEAAIAHGPCTLHTEQAPPEDPDDPDHPDDPLYPRDPDEPDDPDDPDPPDDPVNPVNPADPVSPVNPASPDHPDTPIRPLLPAPDPAG